jgi:hypothetical protein
LPAVFIGYATLAAMVSAAAYALQFIPAFAVGGHYVVPLWSIVMPAAAIAAVHLHRPFGPGVVGMVAAGLLVSSIAWLVAAAPSGAATRRLLSEVAAGDAVVTNCASRGYFPTVSHVLDPGTPVFLATGVDLTEAIRDGWQPPSGTTYFLEADCPGGDDVTAALSAAGYAPLTRVGTLERFRVWRFTVP